MVILAIVLGVTSTITTAGFNNGMKDAFVGTVMDVETGHIEILSEPEEETIKNSESVVDRIEGIPGVRGVAPRIIIGSSQRSVSSAPMESFVVGIKPEMEKKASTLANCVKEGEFLDEDDAYELLVGSVRARDLDIGVGDEIYVTAFPQEMTELKNEYYNSR